MRPSTSVSGGACSSRLAKINGPQRSTRIGTSPKSAVSKFSVPSISRAACSRPRVPLAKDSLGAAMAAHVVEAAQRAVEAMGDQDRLVEDGGRLQVAHSSQL